MVWYRITAHYKNELFAHRVAEAFTSRKSIAMKAARGAEDRGYYAKVYKCTDNNSDGTMVYFTDRPIISTPFDFNMSGLEKDAWRL